MRRSFAIVLAVLGITLFAAAIRAEESQYTDITIPQLKAAMEKKDVVILDANGTDSYRDGHIPGALNFEAESANLEKVLPKDKGALIVAYCGGPQCMAYKAATTKVLAMGYTNVKHLPAGISGWKAAGEKTEKVAAGK
ncbi:MAG TPA: rhodanese-like domain-containing protein [Tepidisphaeraceae bacterium]|jgi:rhodanese-related sulfurtransferase|nr:rhodanese-like domain-containing protein [Tepidisphaeraceae bacterium]